jgi:hypothetical protein
MRARSPSRKIWDRGERSEGFHEPSLTGALGDGVDIDGARSVGVPRFSDDA